MEDFMTMKMHIFKKKSYTVATAKEREIVCVIINWRDV